MSKRFGRNQKRRMREQLQREQLKRAQAEFKADSAQREARRANNLTAEVVERVERMVGRGTVLTEAGTQQINDPMPPGVWRVPRMPGLMPDFEQEVIERMELVIDELPVAMAGLAEGGRHLILRYGEHTVGYAFDPSALARMGRSEAKRMIVNEMAEVLSREIEQWYDNNIGRRYATG